MATPYTRFRENLQALIDSIDHEADPLQRLNNLRQFRIDAEKMSIQARDQAAYELRTKYALKDAALLANTTPKMIDYWAKRHIARHNLPKLPNRRRIDQSRIFDLRGETGASHQPSPSS